jgi:hypothetical protein
MTEQIETLRAIQGRQADDADRDLLALLTADATSRVVTSHDRATLESYVDPSGGKHVLQTVQP